MQLQLYISLFPTILSATLNVTLDLCVCKIFSICCCLKVFPVTGCLGVQVETPQPEPQTEVVGNVHSHMNVQLDRHQSCIPQMQTCQPEVFTSPSCNLHWRLRSSPDMLRTGLWGTADNLAWVEQLIRKEFTASASPCLHVINSRVNEGSLTYDGVSYQCISARVGFATAAAVTSAILCMYSTQQLSTCCVAFTH